MIIAWVPSKDKHPVFGDKIQDLRFATSLQEVSGFLQNDRAEALFIDYLDVSHQEFIDLIKHPFVFRDMLIITAENCLINSIASMGGFKTGAIRG